MISNFHFPPSTINLISYFVWLFPSKPSFDLYRERWLMVRWWDEIVILYQPSLISPSTFSSNHLPSHSHQHSPLFHLNKDQPIKSIDKININYLISVTPSYHLISSPNLIFTISSTIYHHQPSTNQFIWSTWFHILYDFFHQNPPSIY